MFLYGINIYECNWNFVMLKTIFFLFYITTWDCLGRLKFCFIFFIPYFRLMSGKFSIEMTEIASEKFLFISLDICKTKYSFGLETWFNNFVTNTISVLS